jgi:hypothetical protein
MVCELYLMKATDIKSQNKMLSKKRTAMRKRGAEGTTKRPWSHLDQIVLG